MLHKVTKRRPLWALNPGPLDSESDAVIWEMNKGNCGLNAVTVLKLEKKFLFDFVIKENQKCFMLSEKV